MSRWYAFQYYFIRCILFPFEFAPFWLIHFFGRFTGRLAFSLLTPFRKRALSNLSLAQGYWNKNEKTLKATAIESFQNLFTTCLEYPKFHRIKKISKRVTCVNPETAAELISQKQGVIFFCGHQANWELLFLEGTSRMPGVAIGRPIKNPVLYRYITSIRERFGGKMITPRNALKEGLKALKGGKFLGIVGDQGMPESSYAHQFFGRRAFTSPAPAILAYKANAPIITVNIYRQNRRYFIEYSDPVWPDLSKTLDEEIERLMEISLKRLEAGIAKYPGQWLWLHNRWKQQTPKILYYRFRKDPILIVMPQEKSRFEQLLPHLETLKEIFPRMFLSFCVPKSHAALLNFKDAEIIHYERPSELFIRDFRFKLVFNFADLPGLKSHFLNLSAFDVLTLEDLKSIAQEHLTAPKNYTPSDIFKRALCRPGTIWERDG